MSTPAVEARSLSSLTALAANPPAYPRNPTHVRHEPLVLYIARVPGSRDVFLSPMKPRDKVVTAEDIQSSLYYVHVDHPEDARLVTPPPEPSFTENDSMPPNGPPAVQIQRKAVPATLAPPTNPAAPRRKPIPRTLAPIDDFQHRQNISTTSFSYAQPGYIGPDYRQRHSFDSSQYSSENNPPPLPPRRPSEPISAPGTSLTLIRRDPASSAQWNVARVDDPPVLDISSSAINDPSAKKRIGTPVYIEVTNPGYSKFLSTSERPDLPPRPSDLLTISQMSMNNPVNPTARAPIAPTPSDPYIGVNSAETSFRRRLWMEGSKYGGGFGHRKINSQDSNIGRQSPRSSFDALNRDRSSVDLRSLEAPPFLTRDDQANSTTQVPDKQSSFRGYVFTSPWNGRCEFLTGTSGGSLKCRHVVPGPQGASATAMPVSELRFNLPSSSKVSTPMGDESSKRSSFFHRPRNYRNNSSVSEMDLSLGQEFAGGGFGGKQAKLGKLIIEDEGLKMVDLLVAANMALWWRAYERTDGKSRSDRGSFQA